MPLQYDRLIFLSKNVKNFFFFGDAGDRLIDDLQRFERLHRGVKLPDSAINQDESGEFFLLFLQPAIPPRHGFAHAGKIIVLP